MKEDIIFSVPLAPVTPQIQRLVRYLEKNPLDHGKAIVMDKVFVDNVMFDINALMDYVLKRMEIDEKKTFSGYN